MHSLWCWVTSLLSPNQWCDNQWWSGLCNLSIRAGKSGKSGSIVPRSQARQLHEAIARNPRCSLRWELAWRGRWLPVIFRLDALSAGIACESGHRLYANSAARDEPIVRPVSAYLAYVCSHCVIRHNWLM